MAKVLKIQSITLKSMDLEYYIKKKLSSSTSVFRISLYIEVASAVTSCLKKSKQAVDLFGKKPLSDKVNNKNKLILTEIESFLKKLHPFN